MMATILAIILLVILSNEISQAFNETRDTTKEYELYLGEEFILGNDTLIITDYSLVYKNFTLSDGRKVGASIIRSRK